VFYRVRPPSHYRCAVWGRPPIYTYQDVFKSVAYIIKEYLNPQRNYDITPNGTNHTQHSKNSSVREKLLLKEMFSICGGGWGV